MNSSWHHPQICQLWIPPNSCRWRCAWGRILSNPLRGIAYLEDKTHLISRGSSLGSIDLGEVKTHKGYGCTNRAVTEDTESTSIDLLSKSGWSCMKRPFLVTSPGGLKVTFIYQALRGASSNNFQCAISWKKSTYNTLLSFIFIVSLIKIRSWTRSCNHTVTMYKYLSKNHT